MQIKRSELVEGKEYFMDASRKEVGVFKGRGVDSIYFDCGPNSRYYKTPVKQWEGLAAFMAEGDGFEEVE